MTRPPKLILCVDDNEQDLSVMAFLLRTHGFRTLTADNAVDAIVMFGRNEVDLVIADELMPVVDGNQLVRRLKQMAPHIPMILVSDDPFKERVDRLLSADAVLVKKHITPGPLIARIKVMIARRRGPRKGSTWHGWGE